MYVFPSTWKPLRLLIYSTTVSAISAPHRQSGGTHTHTHSRARALTPSGPFDNETHLSVRKTERVSERERAVRAESARGNGEHNRTRSDNKAPRARVDGRHNRRTRRHEHTLCARPSDPLLLFRRCRSLIVAFTAGHRGFNFFALHRCAPRSRGKTQSYPAAHVRFASGDLAPAS